MTTRIHFLDNLRTVLILLVVVLHSGMCYQNGFDTFWIVVDPDKLNALALVNMYLDSFIMFIMFFISGYFIRNSINNRSSWEFFSSKFKRIMIPWLVAVGTLKPAYKAIYLYTRGLEQQDWYSYFHIFSRANSDLSLYSNNPTQSWLWFLPVLFVFQMGYLFLTRTSALRIRISIKQAVILVFVISVTYAMVISLSGLKGWTHSYLLDFQNERLLAYFLFFLLGSLCNKLKVFESTVKKRKYYIIANVVLTIALGLFTLVALNFFYNMVTPDRNYYIISETMDRLLYYAFLMLSTLSFLQIFLYAFRYSFNKSPRWIHDLNRNSYQVYIIHMVVMGLVASVLLHIQMAAILKYILLVFGSFMVSNLLVSAYRVLFKNNNMTKMLALTAVIALLFYGISLGKAFTPTQDITPGSSKQKPAAPELSIHMAALMGDVEAIKTHIQAGTDVDEIDPMGGGSPLGTAATFGKTEVVRILLEAGAKVNFQNYEGSTPLHASAFFGRIEIVQLLLENHADQSIKNKAGSTAYESVAIPFEYVKAIYDQFGEELKPLGLELDYKVLQVNRDSIAMILK